MLVWLVLVVTQAAGAEDADVGALGSGALRGLRDLPLGALLRVQAALRHPLLSAAADEEAPVASEAVPGAGGGQRRPVGAAEAAGAAAGGGPVAEALVGGGPAPEASRRGGKFGGGGGGGGGGGYGYGPSGSSMKKGKQKGMADIFQGSVTALAFLAFAGYIVCLVVHAIRSSGGIKGSDAGAGSGIGGGIGGVGGGVGGVGGSVGGGLPPTLILQPVSLGGGRVRRRRRVRGRQEAGAAAGGGTADAMLGALIAFAEGYAGGRAPSHRHLEL